MQTRTFHSFPLSNLFAIATSDVSVEDDRPLAIREPREALRKSLRRDAAINLIRMAGLAGAEDTAHAAVGGRVLAFATEKDQDMSRAFSLCGINRRQFIDGFKQGLLRITWYRIFFIAASALRGSRGR